MYEILRNQPVHRKLSLFLETEENKETFFTGKLGEVYGVEQDFIHLGLGKKPEKSHRIEAGFKLGQALASKKIEDLSFEVKTLEDLDVVEGLMRAFYFFDKYKSDPKQASLKLNVVSQDEEVLKALDHLEVLNAGVNFARNLVNEPANTVYPESLANLVEERLSAHQVEVEIYHLDQIKALEMDAYLSVAQGSAKEPKLIVMKWMNHPESKEVLGLVGKGLTYDSGGYSIKPSAGMKTMFCDMGGAGTVIATMETIARLNLKANVIAVVAAAENMISGIAYKPGDVIGSMAKKTIEVDNTDAEGRLTLADAIHYITKLHPVTKVIDLATLTGACLVALGETYTGAVTNDEAFMQDVQEAAKAMDEYIWTLPNDKAFKDMNKSEIADLKNSGGRLGGTISAGLFVGEFLHHELPWVHLDIAGTAYLSSATGYRTKGATGVHVKTLVKLIENLQK